MFERHSFLDRVISGEVLLTEIDVFVEKWHQGQSAEDLHEYLGMSPEEYSLWLDNPDTLELICTARQQHQPLAQAINENMQALRLTARLGDGAKLKSLESWLRRQGIPA